MNTETTHKNEIVNTRKGNLGSSDAAMIARLGKTKPTADKLTKADARRLAVVMGKAAPVEVKALNFAKGDAGERVVFDWLVKECERANSLTSANTAVISNPRHVWGECAGVNLIDHIDVQETEDKVIYGFIEIKTSSHTLAELRDEYRYQLAWHSLTLQHLQAGGSPLEPIAHPNATLKLYRYPMEEIEWEGGIDDGYITNPQPDLIEMLLVEPDTLENEKREIFEGLQWLETFLPTFEYVEPNELDADALPANIQERFVEIEARTHEIKRMTEENDAAKAEMLALMLECGISTVRTPLCTFSAVKAKETSRFDSTTFKKAHPEMYAEYCKASTTAASLQVRARKD